MTAIEVYNFINKEIDEFDSPDINLDEGNHFINQALEDFFDKNLSNYEKDEWTRRAFLPLRVAVIPPAATTIDTSVYTNFAICVKLTGVFSYNGRNISVPIRPMSDDTLDNTLLDPFAKPSNKSPKYQTSSSNGVNTITIYSDTAPTALSMAYIRHYNQVNLITAPNAVMDFDPFLTHKKIGKLAVPNSLKTYEDPRFSPAIYEENYAKVTPKIQ